MTLPTGFEVRLAGEARRAGGGRVLVGGSPLTAMTLSGRALAAVRDDRVVVSDPASERLARRLLATNLGTPELGAVPPAAPNQLTVVVPVRDRAGALARLLAGVSSLRCVVVDDASTRPEEIAAVVAEHGAELVPLTENVGPAAARNVGLRHVTTPYVAFVDSDVEVTLPELRHLTRHFADPSVALVGPRTVGFSSAARPRWFERYDAVASSLTHGTKPANVRPGGTVSWLPSACLVGRTEMMRDGFEESMHVGEDVDLVWRLVAAGHLVRYEPAVSARHRSRDTIRGWLTRKAFYGTGGAALARRHGDNVAPAILSPAYAAGAACLLFRRRWSLPAAALTLAWGTRSVRGSLPLCDERTEIAARLAATGLWWALRQESALALRHWSPAMLAACCVSRTVRRVVLGALALDTVTAVAENRRGDRPVSTVILLAGRRLDDLAYGAGLLWGAVRSRSVRALLPRGPRSTRAGGRARGPATTARRPAARARR